MTARKSVTPKPESNEKGDVTLAAVAAAQAINKASGKPNELPDTAAIASTKKTEQPAGVVKRTNQFFIDPKFIDRREGWNPRFDMGEIDALAASIMALKERDPTTGGLLNDIRVKRKSDGRFELVDGDRRLTAIETLMKKGVVFEIGIPAKLEAANADDLELLIRMFTANTGKAFLPLEQAHAFKRMKDAGLTLKDIEKATGASDNTIVGALALLDADQALVDAVKDGSVSGGLAKSIAVNARGDKAKQAELTAQAKAAGKDKKKKAAVKKAIDDARRAKAAKRGQVLKMRALTNDQLSAIGTKLSEILMTRMGVVGLAHDADLEEWMAGANDDMRVAFTWGALQGMKAAAGIPVKFVD